MSIIHETWTKLYCERKKASTDFLLPQPVSQIRVFHIYLVGTTPEFFRILKFILRFLRISSVSNLFYKLIIHINKRGKKKFMDR